MYQDYITYFTLVMLYVLNVHTLFIGSHNNSIIFPVEVSAQFLYSPGSCLYVYTSNTSLPKINVLHTIDFRKKELSSDIDNIILKIPVPCHLLLFSSSFTCV